MIKNETKWKVVFISISFTANALYRHLLSEQVLWLSTLTAIKWIRFSVSSDYYYFSVFLRFTVRHSDCAWFGHVTINSMQQQHTERPNRTWSDTQQRRPRQVCFIFDLLGRHELLYNGKNAGKLIKHQNDKSNFNHKFMSITEYTVGDTRHRSVELNQ